MCRRTFALEARFVELLILHSLLPLVGKVTLGTMSSKDLVSPTTWDMCIIDLCRPFNLTPLTTRGFLQNVFTATLNLIQRLLLTSLDGGWWCV